MDLKKKMRNLRILAICWMLVGFIGVIVSAVIAAEKYGDYPSIDSIIVIVLFFVLMISPLLVLIPLKKAVRDFNEIIIKEYGTAESKAKTYELYYNGFEIFSQTNEGKTQVEITARIGYAFSKYIPRISRMYFNKQGFYCTYGKAIRKGGSSFSWAEVIHVDISQSRDKIIICLGNANNIVSKVIFPFQKNIQLLINTFYPIESEDAE